MVLTNWPLGNKLHLVMMVMVILLSGQGTECKKEKEKKTCGVQVVAIEQIKYKAVPVEVVEQPDPYLMKMMTGGGKGGTTVVTNPTPTPAEPTPTAPPMYPAATTTAAPPTEMMDQMMKMMMKYTANVAKTAAQAVQPSPPAMQMYQPMVQGMVDPPMVEIPMTPAPMPPPAPMMKTSTMYNRPPPPPSMMRPQFYSNRRPGMPPPPPPTAAPTTTTTTTTPAPQKAPSVYLLPIPAGPMMSPMGPLMGPPVAGMTPTSKDMSAPPMHMTPNGPLPMMSSSMHSYSPQNQLAANLLKTLNQIVIPQQLELIPLEIPTTSTSTTTPAPPTPTEASEEEAELEEDDEEEEADPKGVNGVRLDSESGGSPKVNPNIQKNFVDEDETFGRHKSRHRSRSRPFSSSKLANAGLQPADEEEPEPVDVDSIRPNKNVGVRIMDPQLAQQLFSRNRHPPKTPSFAEMLVTRGNSLFQPSDISNNVIDPSVSKSPKRRNWHSSSLVVGEVGASGKVNNSTLISSSSEQSFISKIKGSLSRLVMARGNLDTDEPGSLGRKSASAPVDLPTSESLTTLGASGIQVINL